MQSKGTPSRDDLIAYVELLKGGIPSIKPIIDYLTIIHPRYVRKIIEKIVDAYDYIMKQYKSGNALFITVNDMSNVSCLYRDAVYDFLTICQCINSHCMGRGSGTFIRVDKNDGVGNSALQELSFKDCPEVTNRWGGILERDYKKNVMKQRLDDALNGIGNDQQSIDWVNYLKICFSDNVVSRIIDAVPVVYEEVMNRYSPRSNEAISLTYGVPKGVHNIREILNFLLIKGSIASYDIGRGSSHIISVQKSDTIPKKWEVLGTAVTQDNAYQKMQSVLKRWRVIQSCKNDFDSYYDGNFGKMHEQTQILLKKLNETKTLAVNIQDWCSRNDMSNDDEHQFASLLKYVVGNSFNHRVSDGVRNYSLQTTLSDKQIEEAVDKVKKRFVQKKKSIIVSLDALIEKVKILSSGKNTHYSRSASWYDMKAAEFLCARGVIKKFERDSRLRLIITL